MNFGGVNFLVSYFDDDVKQEEAFVRLMFLLSFICSFSRFIIAVAFVIVDWSFKTKKFTYVTFHSRYRFSVKIFRAKLQMRTF